MDKINFKKLTDDLCQKKDIRFNSFQLIFTSVIFLYHKKHDQQSFLASKKCKMDTLTAALHPEYGGCRGNGSNA